MLRVVYFILPFYYLTVLNGEYANNQLQDYTLKKIDLLRRITKNWDNFPGMKKLKYVDYCADDKQVEIDDSFLVGKWYEVHQFGFWQDLPPITLCKVAVFSRATDQHLQFFKAKFNNTNLPSDIKIDQSRLKLNVSRYGHQEYDFLVTGRGAVKSLLQADNRNKLSMNVKAFKKVNENYMLVKECASRPHHMWLWSRTRNATEKQVIKVIAGIKDVEDMPTQRLCTPISYFGLSGFEN